MKPAQPLALAGAPLSKVLIEVAVTRDLCIECKSERRETFAGGFSA